MHQLIVFDWNGTLIADTQACMAADNAVLMAFGAKPIGLKRYRATVIIPAMQFYVTNGCSQTEMEADIPRARRVFHVTYAPLASKCRSRKGARAVLSYLQSQNIPAIVLSNHTTEDIDYQLRRLGLRHLIRDILANSGLDTAMQSRNKQGKLEHYLNESKIDPQQTIIVGDSMEEVEIGHNLGLSTVAIQAGYYSTARLKASKPDFLLTSLSQILPIIPKGKS